MHPLLVFLYFIILVVLFFVLLFKTTDFRFKLADYLMKKIDSLEEKINKIDKEIADDEEKNKLEEYLNLRKFLGKYVHKGYLLSLELEFTDREITYLLTAYNDHVSFRRNLDGDEEISYKTLDECYEADQVDSINLQRDWGKIRRWKISKVYRKRKERQRNPES